MMHRRVSTFILLALAVASMSFLLVAPTAMADAAGDELAKRIYNRPDGTDQVGRGLMALQQPGKTERVRRLYIYSRQNEQNDFWSLIRFVAPADIKDTGLLSISMNSGQEDQWVYLPALERSRRIPTNRKGGRFVGSDFYYEDLQDRKPDVDSHRILRKEKLEGTPTTVLESIPLDPSNSVYKKRVSWIHEGILLPMRTDFYEENMEQPSKRYRLYRVQKIQGYWTVLDSVMMDLRSNHKTRLVTEVAKYDQNIPESFFSSRALESASTERQFRP